MSDLRPPRLFYDEKYVWIHHEGRTYKAALVNPAVVSRTSRSSVLISDGTLKSPMPGKVLKISALLGSTVKLGQTVCVLEAMKMEYALKAPFDGQVKKVLKKNGELVELDEVIMEIAK